MELLGSHPPRIPERKEKKGKKVSQYSELITDFFLHLARNEKRKKKTAHIFITKLFIKESGRAKENKTKYLKTIHTSFTPKRLLLSHEKDKEQKRAR